MNNPKSPKNNIYRKLVFSCKNNTLRALEAPKTIMRGSGRLPKKTLEELQGLKIKGSKNGSQFYKFLAQLWIRFGA